jgi:hypothetical protein
MPPFQKERKKKTKRKNERKTTTFNMQQFFPTPAVSSSLAFPISNSCVFYNS